MKEFFITFGVKYAREPHPYFHKANPNGYVVVEAPSEDIARRIARAKTANMYAFIYPRDNFDSSYHPKGEIERWVWTKNLETEVETLEKLHFS